MSNSGLYVLATLIYSFDKSKTNSLNVVPFLIASLLILPHLLLATDIITLAPALAISTSYFPLPSRSKAFKSLSLFSYNSLSELYSPFDFNLTAWTIFSLLFCFLASPDSTLNKSISPSLANILASNLPVLDL